MSSPEPVRFYQDFNELLEQHTPLREALAKGRVSVVPPEEGSTRIDAAADVPAYLNSPAGRTLGALVKERGAPSAVAPAETNKSTVTLSRRRPH